MIPATPKNIEWLLERLYDAKRHLQASDIDDPLFVLLTNGKEDRHRVEDMIYRYFASRYGDLAFCKKVQCDLSSDNITKINFEFGITVVLLDVEEFKKEKALA